MPRPGSACGSVADCRNACARAFGRACGHACSARSDDVGDTAVAPDFAPGGVCLDAAYASLQPLGFPNAFAG